MNLFKTYVRADAGNFSMVLAVLAVPLIMALAFAVDMSMMIRQKTHLQDSLDAAVLSAVSASNTADAQDTFDKHMQAMTDEFEIISFSYDNSSGSREVDAVIKSEYNAALADIMGKKDLSVEVSSSASMMPDVSSVWFQPISAKGQFLKDVTLVVTRPSGVQETIGTFVYNPDATPQFTSSAQGWIRLGNYTDISLTMRVHFDSGAQETASIKGWYGDDQSFDIDETGFSSHVWIDGVQLRPDEVITNELLFNCGAQKIHDWEDVPRGYPTTDTPDFRFEVRSKCEYSANGARITR